ncbi:MAG TPA: glycosyltransferase family 1 protein [Candidatus Acidoferrales bacterium]|nr:glycosyltransferase family 1 protein [Candidatus Acidoferrales bacterium]
MIDIALDARLTPPMSVGMKAYAAQMTARLPGVAPDLRFATFTQGANFSLDEQLVFPLRLARARPRLTHFLSLYAPLLAPRPFVITIHDLIHLRFPQFVKRRVGPYYHTVVRSVCARAARVLTDDEKTIGDLRALLGVAPEKVRVVALGVDDVYLAPVIPEIAQRPYFLYAGNHRPHKDLPTLLNAWAALPEDVAVDLWLTGDDDLPPAWHTTRRNGTLRFLGDVTNERLAGLYAGSVALVHGALCEGFGLSMLEAAAVGVRVIATAEAAPSVLAPHMECFPARDTQALSALMAQALEQPEPGRRDALRTIARGLTWDRCARATAEVYREVLAESEAR